MKDAGTVLESPPSQIDKKKVYGAYSYTLSIYSLLLFYQFAQSAWTNCLTFFSLPGQQLTGKIVETWP